MRTFRQFMEDFDFEDDNVKNALSLAYLNHESEVMKFLERLAKHDSDIQIELDKLNFKNDNRLRKKKKIFPSYDSDEIVTPSSDSNYGDKGD